MAPFYALVDALPGRESEVETALKQEPRVLAVARCKERSHDFLVRFDAASFDRVDDFLQTYVRSIRGVAGVEVITDWSDHGSVVAAARASLG